MDYLTKVLCTDFIVALVSLAFFGINHKKGDTTSKFDFICLALFLGSLGSIIAVALIKIWTS